ncbi:sigma-70 family RNA polymerase sigma factor [Stenotrophomonas sp. YIM B06876]|uniref:sigma-70 family RNA polymerase sigma factor n=1 Tax=Stenotrophomonas sp. YIM B06876 TaxID=3060211 RepID=UPI00273A48AD|nr:sigma-70 family RNA polymerase sigma factor [Stenotrophomonas sp. YIM B06876]
MTDPHARMPTPSPGPLDELLSQVARGSREAFESLYRQTSSRLFGVCLRVLGDRAEAEDVLQEVYVNIWNKAGQFDVQRAGAMAWLAMITRNRAIDRLRANPGARTTALELVDEPVDPAATPQQGAETDSEHARLAACMDQLDPRRRSLIHEAFFSGATYEQLASRISSPLGSVKSWIRRGLAQLRVCLEP